MKQKVVNYTIKRHVKALLLILESKNTCYLCPKDIYAKSFCGEYSLYEHFRKMFSEVESGQKGSAACTICESFVNTSDCPCHELGREISIKRTWLALEEGGYI